MPIWSATQSLGTIFLTTTDLEKPEKMYPKYVNTLNWAEKKKIKFKSDKDGLF